MHALFFLATAALLPGNDLMVGAQPSVVQPADAAYEVQSYDQAPAAWHEPQPQPKPNLWERFKAMFHRQPKPSSFETAMPAGMETGDVSDGTVYGDLEIIPVQDVRPASPGSVGGAVEGATYRVVPVMTAPN